ncbi:hypothetical protein ACFH04_10870 [Streptomyces noboritoensis]|uniref:Uncharacterized protein n=1 Tax=Streptomyces noboritoensis TaxID=67337 RepID=A0ABV6TFK8_9ACTN
MKRSPLDGRQPTVAEWVLVAPVVSASITRTPGLNPLHPKETS